MSPNICGLRAQDGETLRRAEVTRPILPAGRPRKPGLRPHLSAPRRGPPCAATTGPSARSPVSAAALIPGAPLDKSLRRLYASAREGAQRSRAHQRERAAPAATRTYGERRTPGGAKCAEGARVRVSHERTELGRGREGPSGSRWTFAPCALTRRAGQLRNPQGAPGAERPLPPGPRGAPRAGAVAPSWPRRMELPRASPAALPPTEPGPERLRRPQRVSPGPSVRLVVWEEKAKPPPRKE